MRFWEYLINKTKKDDEGTDGRSDFHMAPASEIGSVLDN